MTRTAEELATIIEKVRAATESLSDEASLRTIAFEKLLDHELAMSATRGMESNGPPAQSGTETLGEIDTAYATYDARAEAVGRYFGISLEDAGDLFDLNEEAPTLALPSAKIAKSKAQAVRQIALLVCGARTALGLETGSNNIRDAAETYGKVDSNFMAHLTKFEQIAVRGKPSSPNRLVRMRVIGAEAAQRLAQKLVSNGG